MLDRLSIYHNGKNISINLYNNGTAKNIYYYFRWGGETHQGSTGTDILETAIKKVPEIFYDIVKGIKKKGRKNIIRLKELIQEFLEHKKIDLAPRTYVDYKGRSKFLLQFAEERGDPDVLQFIRMGLGLFEDYRKWRESYYDEHNNRQEYKKGHKSIHGRQYSSVSIVPINRECRLLVSVLLYAKDYHPEHFQGIDVPRYSVTGEKKREHFFSWSEYCKIRRYYKKKNYFYYQIITFVDATGIRYPNELNRIVWKDVNFQKRYIEIRNRKGKVNTLIPMIDKTRKVLEELKARDIPKGPEDLVFVNDEGKQVKNITRSFHKCLEDLGIDKPVTMYSWRHTYATREVEKGDLPLHMISYFMGHKDTKQLERTYSKVEGLQYIKSFRKMEKKTDFLSKNMTPKSPRNTP